MRKLGLTLAAAFAATVAAAPASAVTVTFAQGVSTQANNSVVFQNFNTIASGTALDTNTYVYSSNVTDKGAKPSVGSGNYAAVLGGGSYTIALPTFAPVLSFLTGSIDAYNSVTLKFVDTANANAVSYVSYAASAFGANAIGNDGRVTFDTGSSTLLISAVTFLSSQNSFEIDNIASAAPEPATWAMMILGFGFAGMGLRSSRRSRGKLALA